jgi:cytoskeletal protein CcmA (bactofilin family)
MRFFLRQHRRGRAASGQRPAASGAVAARMKRIVAIGLLCSFVVTLLPATRYPLPAIFAPKAEAATGIYRPINYQGKVTSVNGSAVTNGAYNMRFKIFGAATGGNALWTETWSSSTQRVTMTGGLFSVALGTHVTMTGSVDFNSDSLYLQVEFDPGNDGTYEETFSPRRRFASVPYAHNADTLDGLSSEKFVRKDQAETMSGTLTIKPNSASKIGLDILSTAATSGTGGLRISTQGANHIVFGSGGSLYDVNLYRLRANVLKTDDSFYATGTISGATLKADALLSSSGVLITESGAYIDGSTFVVQAGSNRVGIGTASPDSALEVLGTVSGSNVYTIGSVTGTHLYAASTFGGAGLGDCDTAGFSKLLWDASTKRFSCGTDQSAFTSTGSLQVAFDNRYVNTSGDTMTGALVINLSSGTIGLEVIQTISGSMIFANDRLVSSGSLVTESGANIDAGTLYVSAGSNRVGINTVTPSVHLAVSGSVLFDARNGGSVGALHIDIDASTLVGDAIQVYEHGGENAVFRVTEDGEIVAFSGAIIDEGVLYVSAPSNRVGVNTINPKAALDVLGTASGTDLYAARSISGVNLYAATTFGGAGLADCDTAGASKLLWDASTKRFSCGSDQGAFTSTGSLQSAFDSRYVNQSGDTMTGALFINLSSGTVGLEVVQTISGSTIHANSQMRSSGSLVVEGSTTLQGAVTVNATNARVNYVDGSFSGVAGLDGSGRMTLSGSIVTLSATKNQPNMVLISNGNVGVGMGINTPGSRLSVSGAVVIGQGQMASVAADAGLALEVLGTASGTDLYAARSMTGRHLHAVSTFGGAGLADCDADGQTLGWDASTKQFTCGDDDSGGGSGSFGSGNVLTLGDARYVNQSGDTMTGALVISVTGGGLGTLGLRVLNTMSGAIVHAEKDLTSSGTLNIKGSARFQSGAVIRGAEDTAFLTLHDTTNNDGVTIRTGSGSPDGVVSAQLGSLFMDHASGRLYRNNNGTTGWVELMSGSGSVHMAKMTNNAGQSIADTSNTKIDFDTEEFDVGGIASTSTERFVIAKAGRYLVTASVAYQSASQTASFVYIYKNGSAVSSNFLAGGDAAFRQPAVTEVLNLAVGDYIEMYVTQTSGGSNTTHTQVDSRARMSVVQLQDNQGSNFWTMSGGNIYNNNASNVGIGTARPGSKLAVSGAVIISNNGLLSNASVDAGVALEVIGTVSGSTIHANNLLRSSGSLVTESGANLDAGTFYVAAGSNRVGINTLTPKAAFDVAGTMSGSQLIVSRGAFFSGSGITFSTTGSVVFNENSRPVDFRIEGDGNASLFFLDASADRIGIATSAPKATLDVLGTASGTDIYAARSMSGKHLFAMTTFGGAGLTDCDTAGSSKLLWDASTKQFSCGTDQGSLAGADARYVNTSGDTMTGALTISKNSGSTLTISGGVLSHTAYGQPRTLSGVNLARNIISLAVDGRYMVAGMAGGANDDLYYIDVANGSRPSIEGAFNTEFHDVADIAVSGRYAYLALTTTFSSGAELQIIDLSNPSAIRAVGSLDIGDRDAKAVYVSGKFAIVGLTEVGSEDDFLVIDISNPASPRLVGGIDLGASVNDLFVEGRYAYVAAAGAQPFVVDLSNPADPRQVNQGVFVAESYTSVYVSGRYAYTGDNTPLFNIWDVSNPASPSSVGTLALAAEPNAVVVAGKYAYVATDSASGDDVKIIDVSNPALPLAVGGINLGTDVNALGIAGKYLHVGLAATSGTEVRNLDLAGIDAPSAAIGALSTSFLMVYENAMVNNNLYVGNALNVGLGGIESHGPLSVTVTASGSYSGALTGAIIRNRTMTGPVLALDGFRQGSGAHVSPHILFGYQGTFDTVLYRGSASTLRTDDQLLITARDNENRTLIRLDTEETTETINVFEIISDVTANDDRVFRITASGAVYSDAPYNSAGADYAEWFYAGDARLEPGEAVCVDVTRENAVKRCDRDGDVNVMGIVSTRPAFIGNVIGGADGLPVPGYALVGLIGQVPAKVLVESASGAIRPGDSLTAASRPGYARKAKAGESTVGVALQGLASGEGRVNVLISRRNQSLTVEAVEQEVLGTIADMQIDDEVRLMVSQAVEGLDLGDEVAGYVAAQIEEMDLDARIARIVEERLGQMEDPEDSEDPEEDEGPLSPEPLGSMLVGSIAASGSVHVSDTLKARYGEFDETLTVSSDARIGGDLYLEGALIAADLFVPGALSVDGSLDASRIDVASGAVIGGLLSVRGDLEIAGRLRFASGSVLSIDDIVVRDALFVMGDLTIEGLATFLGDVTVKGELGVSSRQAGFAVIPASGTSVTIPFDPPFSGMPVVTATPNGYASMPWWVATPTATGFTIMLKEPAASPITFSWLALATDAAVLTEGATGSLVPAPEEQGIDEASEQPAGTVTSSSAAASSASSDASMSSASSDVSNEGESSMASPSSEPAAESTEPPATSSASPDSPLPGVAPAGAESGASPIWSEFESAEPIEQAVPPVDGTAEEPVPEPPPASGEPAA